MTELELKSTVITNIESLVNNINFNDWHSQLVIDQSMINPRFLVVWPEGVTNGLSEQVINNDESIFFDKSTEYLIEIISKCSWNNLQTSCSDRTVYFVWYVLKLQKEKNVMSAFRNANFVKIKQANYVLNKSFFYVLTKHLLFYTGKQAYLKVNVLVQLEFN